MVAEVKVQMILKLFPFLLSESLFPLIGSREKSEKEMKKRNKRKKKRNEIVLN